MTKPKTKSIEPIFLYRGSHNAKEGKLCFNEAIAYAAGEPHTDFPQCASPLIRSFGMRLNDRLDDERRQLLAPFVLRSVGTASDGRDRERRQLCADWLVEHLAPMLERAGLHDGAARARELTSGSLAGENVLRLLRGIRDEAWAVRNSRLAELRGRVRAQVVEERKRNLTDNAAAAEVAVAAEVAPAAAAEVAYGSPLYWKIRMEVRAKVYDAACQKAREILDPDDQLLTSALDLFDRMLPAKPLQPPKLKDAELLFPTAKAA